MDSWEIYDYVIMLEDEVCGDNGLVINILNFFRYDGYGVTAGMEYDPSLRYRGIYHLWVW